MVPNLEAINLSIKRTFANILFKLNPNFILGGALLVTLIFASALPKLKLNYNIESFFSTADSSVYNYNLHKQLFENENDYLLVGIDNGQDVFNDQFLQKVRVFTSELKSLKNVVKVISPTNINQYIKGPLGAFKIPVVHLNDSVKLQSDKHKIYATDLYTNAIFSSDTNAITILIKKEDETSKAENDVLLANIAKLAKGAGLSDYHIAGRIRTQQFYIDNMQLQMHWFGIASIILIVITLLLIFKNLKIAFIPLIAILVSLIWIFGLLSMLNIPIDLMLTLLPTIVLIISISGGIHLISRFRTEFQKPHQKTLALITATFETGVPNFLNVFTTAIGFASLVFIPVIPIQQFGLVTAISLLIAFAVSLIIIPVLLRVIKVPIKEVKALKQSTIINTSSSKKTILLFLIISLAGVFYISKIQVNNYFLDDVIEGSSLKKDLTFFDTKFSGIRPFELTIKSKVNDILTLPALQQLESVEEYLKNTYGVGFLQSPLTVIKSVNQALNGGSAAAFKIPADNHSLIKALLFADKHKLWSKTVPLISNNEQVARFTGRTKDLGSAHWKEKNEAFRNFIKSNFKFLKYSITGAATLIDNANQHIALNLVKGLIVAILAATIVIWLFTGSIIAGLISIVANLFPLLLIGGIMGFLSVPIKVSTAMLFTIIYGIALDDTIHFLHRYQHNIKKGDVVKDAVLLTLKQLTKPLVYTTVVLMSGFLLFSLSGFGSIKLMGLFTSLALIIALLTDLFLLPALLILIDKRK